MTKISPSAAPAPGSRQIWDAAEYAVHGRFVADLATGVVDLLCPQAGERILDVGCGDGALSARIAATGADVVGVDASASMVEAARARGLDARHVRVTELAFLQEFDAVFSNAALHWVPRQDQPEALARIYAALRPGARFVAEMGGLGNIAAIRTALSAVLAGFGVDAEAAASSFFPSPTQYRRILEGVGFEVKSIDLIARPTALPGHRDGMRDWLNTFRGGVLDLLPATARERALDQTIHLLRPVLRDEAGGWSADYVRLRLRAVRSG